MGAERILLLLIFSLVFSSVAISFVLLQAYGYQTIDNEAAIIPPGAESTSGIQDYTTNTISDDNNYETGFGDFQYQPGVGRVLVSALGEQWLLLGRVSPKNNVYTVNYRINNSVQADYAIAVRYIGSNPFDIVVHVRDDGFHIHNEAIPFLEWNFYPHAGASKVTKPVIKTIFTEKPNEQGVLQFYFDNQLIFTKSDITYPSFFGLIGSSARWYFAGVGSETVGFTVESIQVPGFRTYESSDILGQIATFIEVLARIILWNVNPAFLPWELNLIFIKTQLAGIIICAVVIIRG